MKLKRVLALLLAALLLSLLPLQAFAATAISNVNLRISGRAGGYTAADVEKFVTVRTDGVSIEMADLIPGEGKDAYLGELKVGETYLLSMKLKAADGYAFSNDVSVTCNLDNARIIKGSDTAAYVLVPFTVTGNGGGFLAMFLNLIQSIIRAIASIFVMPPVAA